MRRLATALLAPVLLALAALLAAGRPGLAQEAAPQAAAPEAFAPPHDPYESWNRMVFGWTAGASTGAFAAASGWVAERTPAGWRQAAHNMVQNLREPVYGAAGEITGDLGAAWNSAVRFTLNTTLGGLGAVDVAGPAGYPARNGDLGIALCRAGVLPDAAYLDVPLIGPSTTRDLAARIATNVTLYWLLGGYFYPYYAADQIDRYAYAAPPPALGEADPYARRRDDYLARRRQDCRVAPAG